MFRMQEMIEIEQKSYNALYNPHFRPISNKQIMTVEISPTGSGKTYFYKDTPNTIMLMPTNALVRQNDGMISHSRAREGERVSWNQLRSDRCDYMTYDKFRGHMERNDLSQFNIIIDEAHLVLSSTSEIHYELLKALFTRSFEYKELKLISATIRPEVLELYDNNENELSVCQYIKEGYSPTIQFTKTYPLINPSIKTLFFINSIDKMLQLEEHFKGEFPEIRILRLSSDEEFPEESEFENYDLIFSTSVIKQGYSITAAIDQVVIFNIHHPVGAVDIVQYMSRPRNQQPMIYVIQASTHFRRQDVSTPNLDNLWGYLHRHTTTNEAYEANTAIEINKFFAKSKFSQGAWNVLGVVNYYEGGMKYAELYDNTHDCMKDSLRSMIPSVEVIFRDATDTENLVFHHLEDSFAYLEECANLQELHLEIRTQLEVETDLRVINKLKRFSKVKPIEDFVDYDKKGNMQLYVFTNEIVIRQVLDPDCHRRCKKHIENIKMGAYTFRDKHDKRYLPKIGETYDVLKLGRKLNFMNEYFQAKQEPVILLYNLYSANIYSSRGKLMKYASIRYADYVEITGNHTVEDSWYRKVETQNGLLLRLKVRKDIEYLREYDID